MSSSRTFTSSLKPMWSSEKIEKFVSEMTGTAIVYVINHDKDKDENGEIVEGHTHVYLEYQTPRKTSTVANLLEVETNFIELVRNKKGMLRYLTHMDDNDKHRYNSDEVITNNSVGYENAILGNSMSDKEIADYIISGKGIDLLGIIPAGRLRTIQGFVHFDTSNKSLQVIRGLETKIDNISDGIDKIIMIADGFNHAASLTLENLGDGMKAIGLIAEEMKKANRTMAIAKSKR